MKKEVRKFGFGSVTHRFEFCTLIDICPNIYLDLVFNMKLAIYPRIIADSLFKHKNIIRGSQDLYIAPV
jgi:hypothetical protein